MTRLTRRNAIKYGGAVLASSGLIACEDAQSPDKQQTESSGLYDRGEVPIALSGWTKTRGMGKQYSPPGGDIDTDVLVVGAGLAGSSLALHLAELGIDTVVLEARQPGWGASGRNAGHVLPLLRDTQVFEQFPDQGKAFFELFREHHTIPFDIANKYGIECDAAKTGYLNGMASQSAFTKFALSSALPASQLGQELTHLDAVSMREMTGSDYYPYGVLYESGGRINPYLFTAGMIAVAQEKGARVFGESTAETISVATNGWRVKIANGASVACKRVIFCTNAYSTDIVPQFKQGCYPVTAYALSTEPLPLAVREYIMPSKATFAQLPLDLNPFLVDENNRIITASLPSRANPGDGEWHFKQHLKWIHRTWPETRDVDIKMETYWTGRVAMRDREFPGMYQLASGIYGLMHFNAWGNVMAPLMGMALAQGVASDRIDQLPFPVVQPDHIVNPQKQEFLIRSLMIPAARFGQRLGLI